MSTSDSKFFRASMFLLAITRMSDGQLHQFIALIEQLREESHGNPIELLVDRLGLLRITDVSEEAFGNALREFTQPLGDDAGMRAIKGACEVTLAERKMEREREPALNTGFLSMDLRTVLHEFPDTSAKFVLHYRTTVRTEAAAKGERPTISSFVTGVSGQVDARDRSTWYWKQLSDMCSRYKQKYGEEEGFERLSHHLELALDGRSWMAAYAAGSKRRSGCLPVLLAGLLLSGTLATAGIRLCRS